MDSLEKIGQPIMKSLAGIFDFAVAANIIFFGLMIVVMIPTGVFVTRYLANIYETAFLEPEDDIEEFDDF